MNIRNKVAVIGAGCSKFGEHYDMSAEDTIVTAAFEAYTDAKIDPSQIQAAWVGTLSSANAGNALADPLSYSISPLPGWRIIARPVWMHLGMRAWRLPPVCMTLY